MQRELEENNRELLTVPGKLKSPDPLIVAAQEAFDKKRKEKSHNGLYTCDRKLNIYVSPSTASRAFRLMDTFIKALKALGHDVLVDYQGTFAVIEGERLEIGLKEKQTKFIVKRGTWDHTEYRPSGLLAFWHKKYDTREWADGKNLIEKRISRIIATLVLRGRKEHTERLERERVQAERAERERIYREKEALQEHELAGLKNILVEAERWRQAKVMRDYADEVVKEALGNNAYTVQLGEWAEWVRKKADWYDPQVKCHDELLTNVNWDTLTLEKKPSHYFW